jgi:CRISPR/Cas system-associated endonuclease/helicase Cas3
MLSGEKNLVYTAPTGGGKSLVAEILMLRRIIEDPVKKAIVVLPYVTLVQEKMKWLRRLVEGVRKIVPEPELTQSLWQQGSPQSAIRVGGFLGGSKARSTWADIDIAVCTIEKVGCKSELLQLYDVLIPARRTP